MCTKKDCQLSLVSVAVPYTHTHTHTHKQLAMTAHTCRKQWLLWFGSGELGFLLWFAGLVSVFLLWLGLFLNHRDGKSTLSKLFFLSHKSWVHVDRSIQGHIDLCKLTVRRQLTYLEHTTSSSSPGALFIAQSHQNKQSL